MKRFYQKLGTAFTLFLLACLNSFGQLDTLHYFPPIHEAYPTANQGAIYISTPSLTPVTFTLTDGAGTFVASGSVTNTSYFRYLMTGVNTTILVPAASLNTVLTNKGFIVHASAPVYANLRYEAVNHNQSFSITAKGRKAFGTSFRIAHAKADAASASNSIVSVMATSNNTQVSINLVGTGLVLSGAGAPSTAAPLTFTLNQGESYCIAVKNSTNGANRDNMIGRLITSNRPIVTVMGNYLGCFVSGNHDIGLDQPVPEELLGTDYAFLQGAGANAKEKVLIVANQNNTDVFVNGNAVPYATLNAGDHVEIPGTNYTVDSAMFVHTTQPAYAWQVLFGRDSYANWGLNFVPPFSCLTERFVDFIPAIDSIGTRAFSGNLNIFTYAGSTLLINGAPPSVAPVPIPGSALVGYRVHSLSGSFSITSNTIAVVGFYGFNGASSYAGYYSGFDSIPQIFASIEDTVCPDTLFVRGGFDNYHWFYNSTLMPGATDTFFALNGMTGNFNVAVSKGACVDTSGTFVIACILPSSLNYFEANCSFEAQVKFRWAINTSLNLRQFVIQASTNTQTWRSIAVVNPASGLSGEYTHTENRAETDHYYRIVLVDENGMGEAGATVEMLCDADQPSILVITHPSDPKLDFVFAGFGEALNVEIHAMDGQLLFKRDIKIGQNGHFLIDSNAFPSGIYLVTAKSDGHLARKKFLIP